MRVFVAILGVLLTLWILKAMVENMLVPRGTNSLMARGLTGLANKVSRAPLPLMRTYWTQDRWIAGAAPVSVLMQLVLYFALIIVSMSLVIFGTSDLTLGQSLYQSGATVTTLGIVEPIDDVSVIACFVAAFLGLVVVAVFIGYLMALYGAYISRESHMARLALLAGQPPWGPEVLARSHLMGMKGGEAFSYEGWVDWICDVRMAQNVNPVVAHFRSTDPMRHWVAALIAVTDAVALRLSAGLEPRYPHEVQLLMESALAMRILTDEDETGLRNGEAERKILDTLNGGPGAPEDAGLTDEDWAAGLHVIRAANAPVPSDTDAWRQRFFGLRGFYAPHAYALAQEYHAVPAPWTGPRKPPLPTIWPRTPGRVSTSGTDESLPG